MLFLILIFHPLDTQKLQSPTASKPLLANKDISRKYCAAKREIPKYFRFQSLLQNIVVEK